MDLHELGARLKALYQLKKDLPHFTEGVLFAAYVLQKFVDSTEPGAGSQRARENRQLIQTCADAIRDVTNDNPVSGPPRLRLVKTDA